MNSRFALFGLLLIVVSGTTISTNCMEKIWHDATSITKKDNSLKGVILLLMTRKVSPAQTQELFQQVFPKINHTQNNRTKNPVKQSMLTKGKKARRQLH